MQTITIENDIKIFYVTATSFPDGALAAHQSLHSLIPYTMDRRYFGISRPENGGEIVYRAAAEEINEGEAEKLNCETLILKKGNYTSLILKDYLKDLQGITRAFETLLTHPNIDPQGYCVELFLGEHDMQCMVRLEE
jgi:hypothetical protein